MNAFALDHPMHWLLRTSLEASVLILAVLALRMILGPRLGPPWRFSLWLLVGLKLLLPACIPAGFGLGSWAQVPALEAAGKAAVSPVQSAELVPRQATGNEAATAPAISPLALITGLWLAGAVSVLGAALLRQWRFEKRLNLAPRAADPHLTAALSEAQRLAGIQRNVQAVLLPPTSTPAMTGLLSPRVLVPSDWAVRFDESSLRHVLLHELLHIRHRDLWWNWATLIVQALHWFNPLVWIIGSRFQADRELRCDAAVLSLLSPNERLSYGHTLLRIQETFFAPPAIAGLAPCVRNHPALLHRILMIARPNRSRPWLHALFTLVFGIISCYAFTTVKGAEEKDRPSKERDGARSPEAERDGKTRTGPRDGEKPKKDGPRDGDSPKKSGPRDGDKPAKAGKGDLEGGKTGPRDGEKKSGPRDGDRPKTGEREGDRPRENPERKAAAATGETLTFLVSNQGNTVVIGKEEVPMNRLRGYLQTYLPGHPGAEVIVFGDADVNDAALANVVDAVRDNGNKNVRLSAD